MKTKIKVSKTYQEEKFEPFTGEIEILVDCKDLEEVKDKYRDLEDTLNDLICERIEGLKED